MSRLVLALLTLAGVVRQEDADALRQTAPTYLTTASAAEHLAAARWAGNAHHVAPALLLAIAWHESRYEPRARTREPGGRWSCGVMTPEPHAGACTEVELDMVGGYLNGARHLRTWLDLCGGDETCALRAYAGGFALVRACASGPYYVRDGVDACDVDAMFTARARAIRARMQRGTSS